MAAADASLDTMIDRLRTLSDPDRRAVLDRLSPGERVRVDALLRAVSAAGSRYSADIADRIAALPDADVLTPTARDALSRIAPRRDPVSPVPLRADPLLDRLVGWMRRR